MRARPGLLSLDQAALMVFRHKPAIRRTEHVPIVERHDAPGSGFRIKRLKPPPLITARLITAAPTVSLDHRVRLDKTNTKFGVLIHAPQGTV